MARDRRRGGGRCRGVFALWTTHQKGDLVQFNGFYLSGSGVVDGQDWGGRGMIWMWNIFPVLIVVP